MKRTLPLLVLSTLVLSILAFWTRVWTLPLAQSVHALISDFLLANRIAEMSGSLMILVGGLVVAAFVYFCYVLFTGAEKKVQLHFAPWMVLLGGIIFAYVLFFVQVGDVWSVAPGINQPMSTFNTMFLSEFGGVGDNLMSGGYWFFAFSGKLIWSLLALFILFLGSLGLGSFCKKLTAQYFVVSRVAIHVALGLAVIMLLSFFMGIFGVMSGNYLGLSLLLIGVVLTFVRMRDILKAFLFTSHSREVTARDRAILIILGSTLTCALTVTILHLIRPIPIGWDDIGVYMNIPSLLNDYGHLVSGFGPYNFGLVTQLGFTVFGDTSIAMLFTFFGGLMAITALYAGLKEFLGKQYIGVVPLLLTAVFAMTPFVLFQLGEDMKIDLPLLFYILTCFILLLDFIRNGESRTNMRAIIIGVLLGVSLGIKFTSLLFVFFVLTVMCFASGGWLLFTAGAFFFLTLLFGMDVFSLGGLVVSSGVKMAAIASSFLFGLVCIGFAFVKKEIVYKNLSKMIITFGVAFLCVLPWFMYNYTSMCDAGKCQVSSVHDILYGKFMSPPAPILNEVYVKTVADSGAVMSEADVAKSQLLQASLASSGGALKEELGRYAGYNGGIFQYLTIPLDTIFNVNVVGDYVIVGWVFLFLFVTYILVLAGGSIAKSVSMFGYFVVLVLLSLVNVSLVGPDFLNYLLPVLAVIPFIFVIIKSEKETWEKVCSVSLMLYGLLWIFTSTGVIWYGIGGFALLFVFTSGVLSEFQEKNKQLFYPIVVAILAFWIMPMWFHVFSKTETSMMQVGIVERDGKQQYGGSSVRMRSFDQRHFTMYKMGLFDADQGFNLYNRDYYASAKDINETSGNVYRIGTMIPYFVKRNATRIFTDNQLDYFISMYLPHKNKSAVVKSMRDSGYAFIMYDTGTASIDTTEGKTLEQKVKIFEEFVNGNPDLTLIRKTGSHILWKIN